ncbi:MAG: hypothetical protein KHY27_12200, partial [Butyricicoccus pullicaecorum]|nr:hypothetical protein [Butyricicoccus pullicaecorum]
ADQMISIDLDDGVKKNYAIFQDVLATPFFPSSRSRRFLSPAPEISHPERSILCYPATNDAV